MSTDPFSIHIKTDRKILDLVSDIEIILGKRFSPFPGTINENYVLIDNIKDREGNAIDLEVLITHNDLYISEEAYLETHDYFPFNIFGFYQFSIYVSYSYPNIISLFPEWDERSKQGFYAFLGYEYDLRTQIFQYICRINNKLEEINRYSILFINDVDYVISMFLLKEPRNANR